MLRIGMLLVGSVCLAICGCTPAPESASSDPGMTEAPPWQAPAASMPSTASPDFSAVPAPVSPDPASAPPSLATGGIVRLGEYEVTAPSTWQRKQPAMSMIQDEFSIPAAEGDEQGGRMTVMQAGGTVEANIERWKAQFRKADGSPLGDDGKVEKLQLSGQEVSVVDLSGTYADSPGPFAPPTMRAGYRMLAAIVPTGSGAYFIKFYGPAKTVAANETAFRTMIEGLAKAGGN